MKTWYRAVCDEHKEMCHILVSNPSCGAHYLKQHDKEIQKWLTDHSNCELRLVHRDENLEPILGVYEDFPKPISDKTTEGNKNR